MKTCASTVERAELSISILLLFFSFSVSVSLSVSFCCHDQNLMNKKITTSQTIQRFPLRKEMKMSK